MFQVRTTTILDRLLDPLAECLTPETAHRLVNLRADEATQALLDDLADKCNEGQLNDSERQEYETCVRAINLITILQAKARTLLERQAR
jgi:hypothetical protein